MQVPSWLRRSPRQPDEVWRELQRFRRVEVGAGPGIEGLLRELRQRDELQRELIDALRAENDQLREKCSMPRRSWLAVAPAGAASTSSASFGAANPKKTDQNDAAPTSSASIPAPPPAPRVVRVACAVRGTLSFAGVDLSDRLLGAAAAQLAVRGVEMRVERIGAGGGPAPNAALLFWREESRGAPEEVLAALSALPPASRRAVVFMHRVDLGAAPPAAARHEAFVASRLPDAALMDGVFDDLAADVAAAALAAAQNRRLLTTLADFFATC